MVDALTDVHDLAADFFTRFYVAEAQMVADGDYLLHQDEGAMGVYDLRDGLFGKRGACRKVTTDNNVDGEKDALAAANGAWF